MSFKYKSNTRSSNWRCYFITSNSRFLIILDNLVNVEWVESFLVNMPENVHILLTSRNPNILSKFKALDDQAVKLEVNSG